ncbi:hypothetical protein CsSME_00052568 [Camellia sinensis var. sinensis]
MWQWQCHKTQRQVMFYVGKCKTRLVLMLLAGLKADMDGSSWQLYWHDAKLNDMAVIVSYACKGP